MNKEFIENNSKVLTRALEIICINFPAKMSEIQNQHNECYNCHSTNIKYPRNDPRSRVSSWGDSENFFTSHGNIDWKAVCGDCGNDMYIYVNYDFDIKKGFTVESGDFLNDEFGNYGHFKTTDTESIHYL